MSNALLAGAWCGEYGWQLSTWIPALRHISPNYEKIIIVCHPECRYLYEDFADIFENHINKHDGDMWYRSRFPTLKPKMPRKYRKKHPGAQVVIPNKYMCMKAPRKYFMYGKKLGKGYDIVIHARAEDKYGQSKLNYNPAKYKKMLKELRLEHNLSACSIGTKAYHIDGTSDMCNLPLDDLCNILRNAKVCVGTSSGTMHLAHLCGCPIVVLTDDSYQKGIKGTNRDRYLVTWRAFPNVPVKIIDKYGWHPPVEVVTKEVRRFL